MNQVFKRVLGLVLALTILFSGGFLWAKNKRVGTTVPDLTTIIGGKDPSGNAVVQAFDADGAALPGYGWKECHGSFGPVTLASAATDFGVLKGSGAKKVLLTRVCLGGTATDDWFGRVLIYKRSTLTSGGTAAVVTSVVGDSRSNTPTAVLSIFSANPTPGTAIGVWDSLHLALSDVVTFNLNARDSCKDVYLPGGTGLFLKDATECAALNLNGATATGNLVYGTVYWLEKDN